MTLQTMHDETESRDQARYYVFTRTWWKRNPSWPNGKEPCAGRRTTLRRNLSYSEARAMCQEWNANHNPGFLSRKAEFDQQ